MLERVPEPPASRISNFVEAAIDPTRREGGPRQWADKGAEVSTIAGSGDTLTTRRRSGLGALSDERERVRSTLGSHRLIISTRSLGASLPSRRCSSHEAATRLSPTGICFLGESTGLRSLGTFAELHTTFADVGLYEPHVVDASGHPEDVAANVLTAFREGRIAVIRELSAGPDGKRTG